VEVSAGLSLRSPHVNADEASYSTAQHGTAQHGIKSIA
jgi:hypothetical protein